MSNIVQAQLQPHIFSSIHNTVIPGFCNMTVDDWIHIDKLIEDNHTENMQFCEIGSNEGHSVCLLGIWAKKLNGRVITIDPLQFDDHVIELEVLSCLQDNLDYFSLENCVQFVNDYSYHVAHLFSDNEFDFIFIDGNHEYEAVKQDINLYWPKLKTGGIMCGHDCEFLVNHQGIVNIKNIRNSDFEKPFSNGSKTIYGHETLISVPQNGNINLKQISNWEHRDIIGLYWNKNMKNPPVIGVHPGTIIAVSEIFGDKAQIVGDRIWWIKKS
jgi:hypothetical protein